MKETAVHGTVAQHADSARIAVRQNGLRPVTAGCFFEPGRDCVQRLVPTHALERLAFRAPHQRPFGNGWLSTERVENPIRRVDAIKIFGYLAAQKTLRHRLGRIALDFDRASLLVYLHQHGAGVRAIVRTDRVHDAKRSGCGSRVHAVIVS